jgi:signal transduction histidine kinase
VNITILRLGDNKFIEANDAFVRWIGLSRDQILGHDSEELGIWVNAGDREVSGGSWCNGSLREVECSFVAAGHVHTIVQSADIIEINRETHSRIGLDITQRKQAEVELLRTLAREKELGQLRSNFVSMVSHEFRNPLGIIQSSAEILGDYLEYLAPAERLEYLQSICKNTRRMAELMEEALLIGSLDAGKMEFRLHRWATVFAKALDEVLSATDLVPDQCCLAKLSRNTGNDVCYVIFSSRCERSETLTPGGGSLKSGVTTEIVCAIRDKASEFEADQEWLFNAFHRGHNVADAQYGSRHQIVKLWIYGRQNRSGEQIR